MSRRAAPRGGVRRPPEVEKWHDGTQVRYGNRVGCMVLLSLFAKSGFISKALRSHVSLLNFCAKTFGTEVPTSRVASSDDMADCFDFKRAPGPPPPTDPK